MAKTAPPDSELLDKLKYVQQQLSSAGYYKGSIDGLFYSQSQTALAKALQDAAKVTAVPIPMHRKLTEDDIKTVAAQNGLTAAHIHAVIEVESGGGWFTDIRADILNLDGPGGFIDGDMPKILFEAHHFSRLTGGQYDRTHPNISSKVWNKALYRGGQAEYIRLNEAMTLNESAALQSASWGMFQIMGFNYGVCGYIGIHEFVTAMKLSEVKHIEAFINFIRSKDLLDKLRDGNWAAFAKGYNGTSYFQNKYDTKLEAAYKKYA